MSSAATTGGITGDPGSGPPARLTPEAIESVLNDFRTWLVEGMGDRGAAAASATPPGSPPTPGIDLFTLIGQFTALRHEVNLQTKAARAGIEQNAEVLKQLAAVQREAQGPGTDKEGDSLRPLVKAVIDVADALTLSLRQMEKLKGSAEPLLADLLDRPEPPAASPPKPGLLGRFFQAPPPPVREQRPPERALQAADKLRQFFAAAADGYAMSLRRVERVLPALGVEALSCAGRPFDPEVMEVVEVVGDTGEPSGTVVEDVRPGYYWRGRLLRFAQVKVAR